MRFERANIAPSILLASFSSNCMNTTNLKFEIIPRTLQFRFDAGTSRGVLKARNIWWVKAYDLKNPNQIGWGEAAPLVKLSPDDRPDFEEVLKGILEKCERIEWPNAENEIISLIRELVPFELPSIRFGLEMALLDWLQGGDKRFFKNSFFDEKKAIPINGLIWMGEREFMFSQIREKLDSGFSCIKMKIGAIDFEQELELLSYIRSQFSAEEIVLRVDANGAFAPNEALEKLKRLSELEIHSIEQPIKAGQWEEMANLCGKTPLPIALDEELIGCQEKEGLLDKVQPQHIILKPTLVGGFDESRDWIKKAEDRSIGWWMTSALESNIGLNAIAQLTSQFEPTIPQGLGTGKLYHNNLESPLMIQSGKLVYGIYPWEIPS